MRRTSSIIITSLVGAVDEKCCFYLFKQFVKTETLYRQNNYDAIL